MAHPQYWPESLDYTGKRIVVIGSGATAISLIPTLTEKAAHVTMLQRSPSYLFSMPRIEPMARAIQKVLPRKLAHSIIRWRNALFLLVHVSARPQVAQRHEVGDPPPRHPQSARRLRRRHAFQTAVQPVGSADVHDIGFRLVQGDQRRSG